jgi:hypothetical protein|tara:strand:+ start:154 stop:627 length:474 start_codon:yes stop_codon:yes gene_type:complete
MPNFKKNKKPYMMKPKGMGGQAYKMIGGKDPKKKKSTKMVDLVPRDKSGKPIPQVRGGAGLLGFVGGNAVSAVKQGVSAGKKLFKAFSNAPKQYTGKGGSNLKSFIKQYKSSKMKSVPVVGKPGKTVKVPKSSKTKQVSYVNPRISMTAKERAKAGY